MLARPEIPLNTNASENDIRTVVTKRKISSGTISEKGRDARDVMLGLYKTCKKLTVLLPLHRRAPGKRRTPDAAFAGRVRSALASDARKFRHDFSPDFAARRREPPILEGKAQDCSSGKLSSISDFPQDSVVESFPPIHAVGSRLNAGAS